MYQEFCDYVSWLLCNFDPSLVDWRDHDVTPTSRIPPYQYSTIHWLQPWFAWFLTVVVWYYIIKMFTYKLLLGVQLRWGVSFMCSQNFMWHWIKIIEAVGVNWVLERGVHFCRDSLTACISQHLKFVFSQSHTYAVWILRLACHVCTSSKHSLPEREFQYKVIVSTFVDCWWCSYEDSYVCTLAGEYRKQRHLTRILVIEHIHAEDYSVSLLVFKLLCWGKEGAAREKLLNCHVRTIERKLFS